MSEVLIDCQHIAGHVLFTLKNATSTTTQFFYSIAGECLPQFYTLAGEHVSLAVITAEQGFSKFSKKAIICLIPFHDILHKSNTTALGQELSEITEYRWLCSLP